MFALAIALAIALAATILLTPLASAQDSPDSSTHKYTVWSSVIFSRTGERTPLLLDNARLTSLGAQQQHEAGAFFRERYISTFGSSDGIDSAPIQGLNANELDGDQLYVMALDQQYNQASAQAFVQGLYPPYSLSGNDSETTRLLDPEGLLANGSYIEGPLNGYQYAQIHAADDYDIEFPYMAGHLGCNAWAIAATDYYNTASFLQTQAVSSSIYSSIGPVLLDDILAESQWDYVNAYSIYDYISYQATHNTTVESLLSDPRYINSATNVSYLDTLRWYADEQQFAWLGNPEAQNSITGSQELADGIAGSISTIAGNMLAAKLLAQLQINVQSRGEAYKLNLLFGGHEPLMSFFALAQLPPLNSHFYGLPAFASVAAFELFSYTSDDDTAEYPDEEDLWVRFWFRNGTGGADANNVTLDGSEFQAYSLFNFGPSSMDLKWATFQEEMYKIVVADIGDWCTQCGAQVLFCAAWNQTLMTGVDSSSSYGGGGGGGGVSPAVGGVIGAVVTLVIAGLAFALAMLVGGVRLHRVQQGSHKSELGGFKGGQKMRSDQDLAIPKGGAVVGATVESSSSPGASPTGGHERVGSWELKHNEAGLPNIAGAGAGAGDVGGQQQQMPQRPSFEDDDIGSNPFRDPVKADERV